MGTIITFKPKQTELEEAFKNFKETLQQVNADEIEGSFFYIKLKNDDIAACCLNPNWEMAGIMSEFLNEVKLNMYVESFRFDESFKEE